VSNNLQTVPGSSHIRQTAEERRVAILAAAVPEFARGGLHGTPTEAIARRAGISQPYLFRLFGTKKQLFLAVVGECFRRTRETFAEAAGQAEPGYVLEALGAAYMEALEHDNLLAQLQAYAACSDDEVREAVESGYRELVAFVGRLSGAGPDEVGRFFATGMLINVIAAMGLLGEDDSWGSRLVQASRGK
jgi:AcrR family transcriptional regulator